MVPNPTASYILDFRSATPASIHLVAVESGQYNVTLGVGIEDYSVAGEAESVRGGTGNDVVYGQENDDRLSGDAGDDTLNSGDGSDIFLFNTGFGHDTVEDFGTDDVMKFSGISGISAQDFIATANVFESGDRASLADNEQETVLQVKTNNTITLTSVSPSSLCVNDFQFTWILPSNY